MTKSRKSRSSSKSNAAMLFNRYVWLVDTIYRAGRITFEEINERWQRSSLSKTGEASPEDLPQPQERHPADVRHQYRV